MDRPRRTIRPPARLIETETVAPPPRKRKKPEPAEQLHVLLTSPKSQLVRMDISDVINANTWNMLSEESKASLKGLLPPTAFRGFRDSIPANHPSITNGSAMPVEPPAPEGDAEVESGIFKDSYFLSAAHTFQDHIYSNWLSDKHMEDVRKYEEGVKNGTLAAPWKDEEWERNNPLEDESKTRQSQIKLSTLVEKGILQVADVIVLKHHFAAVGILVEKDAVIRSIHPKTHAITVLIHPGSTTHLPTHLISPSPAQPSAPTQEAVVTAPAQLENALLDNDARIERSQRPNGNAWKSMSVWRWRGTIPSEDVGDGRWGRANHGTLFYLRGTYQNESCRYSTTTISDGIQYTAR
ncbi:hypothetical protein H0H92_005256 [Tricholoma furcatifolium]|nr:hypothetical protein H0H92_005256 [Tricholoma furcatifolium]